MITESKGGWAAECNYEVRQSQPTHQQAWHNGYRAACKEICERFGLDNTDEIELLVKERDRLKAELAEARKTAEQYHMAANELRMQLEEARGEIAELKEQVAYHEAAHGDYLGQLRAVAECMGGHTEDRAKSMIQFVLDRKNEIKEGRQQLAACQAEIAELKMVRGKSTLVPSERLLEMQNAAIDLSKQLAAAQADNVRLRTALTYASECLDANDNYAYGITEALSTTSDMSALREVCMRVAETVNNPFNRNKTLTEIVDEVLNDTQPR